MTLTAYVETFERSMIIRICAYVWEINDRQDLCHVWDFWDINDEHSGLSTNFKYHSSKTECLCLSPVPISHQSVQLSSVLHWMSWTIGTLYHKQKNISAVGCIYFHPIPIRWRECVNFTEHWECWNFEQLMKVTIDDLHNLCSPRLLCLARVDPLSEISRIVNKALDVKLQWNKVLLIQAFRVILIVLIS